jgi:glycosyltransferase involved in cell wall biosynthesis
MKAACRQTESGLLASGDFAGRASRGAAPFSEGNSLSDQESGVRPAKFRTARQVAGRFADAARRLEHSFPPPARARVRDLVAWFDRQLPAPPIEDWSAPLIGTGTGSGTGSASRNVLIGAAAANAGLGVVGVAQRSESRPPAADPGPPELRCLVVTSLLDVGGMDEMVAFLARRLPAFRLRTAVLHATSDPSPTGEPSGRLGRMLQSTGVDVHEADEKSALSWIEQWRPDVITAHGAPPWVLGLAERAGVPYVDNLHGMHMLFWADWQAETARSAKISAIVSVSELCRQQYLAGNPGFPPDRLVTVPNGVDEERRVSGDRAAARDRLGLSDEYVFLSLARHCLQKNSYGLITAFAELARHRPEAHLVIAGRPDPGRYYRQTLRLRDSLPCRDRIHLRDHAAAPAELLAAADGFVLDSFFEGWSLASMEALFAGLPVVLSEVGGAREQIGGDPSRGYLVANPLGDPLSVDWASVGAARYQPQVNQHEFATAMDRLITDRKSYLRDRDQLAAESAARFSAGACLAQHAAILRAVATGADLPGDRDANAPATDTGRDAVIASQPQA